MRTLVLNAGYEPLAVVSFKRALVLLMTEKATVIAADEDNPVHGATGDYVRPSVILLTRYVRIPSSRTDCSTFGRRCSKPNSGVWMPMICRPAGP